MDSACQQDAEKQGSLRAGAGHGAEDRKPGGAARVGVQEGRNGCRYRLGIVGGMPPTMAAPKKILHGGGYASHGWSGVLAFPDAEGRTLYGLC